MEVLQEFLIFDVVEEWKWRGSRVVAHRTQEPKNAAKKLISSMEIEVLMVLTGYIMKIHPLATSPLLRQAFSLRKW